MLCEMTGVVLDTKTGKLLEYRPLIRHLKFQDAWSAVFGKGIGHLMEGLPGVVEGTNTIGFIMKDEVPADKFKDTTYARIGCNYRSGKEDLNRVRIMVGGSQLSQGLWHADGRSTHG